MALEMLQNLENNDFDAGDLSEVESDSDLSWDDDNLSSSSERDSESIPRKKTFIGEYGSTRSVHGWRFRGALLPCAELARL